MKKNVNYSADRHLDLIFAEKPAKKKNFLHIHKHEYMGEDENFIYFECDCGHKKCELIKK